MTPLQHQSEDAPDGAAGTSAELTELQERQLQELLQAAGFGAVLRGLGRIARRWSDHPDVDTRFCADLRALARRLEVIAQDMRSRSRLR